MFGSTVLEVAVGMVFVYLLVSLVCSGISDRISDILSWRAKDLEKGLRDLLMGGDQKLLNQLYNNKLIQSLSTIKAEKLNKIPGQEPASDMTVAPGQPDAKPQNSSTRTPTLFPTNVPARTFVLAMFNALVPGESGQTTISELRDSIGKMKDSALKSELQTLITGADLTIETARTNVEQWYNAAEAQMTYMYKQNMWKVALIIGLIISAVLNIDTAAVASNLWRDPTLRAAVVAQATEYAKNDTLPAGAVSQSIDQINDLNLPVGWSVNRDLNKMGQCLVPANWVGLNWCAGPADWVNWKPIPSSSTTTKATTTPQAFNLWVSLLIKLLGWVITAFAGAQGAPFWFDILKKLTAKPAS